MTPDAPQNLEYIIKESQLAGIWFALEDTGVPKNNLLFKEIRSRPLPEHDKQVREKVLDIVKDHIVNDRCPWKPGTDERYTDARALLAFIKELRGSP